VTILIPKTVLPHLTVGYPGTRFEKIWISVMLHSVDRSTCLNLILKVNIQSTNGPHVGTVLMLVMSTSKSFKLAEILLCISLAIYSTITISKDTHVILTVYCIVEKSMKNTIHTVYRKLR
jgi:hypothetical protein